jgi:kynurenine formamidase
MDAACHFGVSKETIDRMDPDRFVAPGIRIRVPDVRPGMSIGTAILRNFDILDLQEKALLIQTGWSRHVQDASLYRDALPRISPELAEKIVESGIKILGVEPPSVADVNNMDELTEVHEILLGGKVTIVEGLANLDRLSGGAFLFMALPLKIHGGDGSPVRAVAIESDD